MSSSTSGPSTSSFTTSGRAAIQSSPRRNRVTPTGDIVAVPQRGAWLGNRGILHVGVAADARVVRAHRGSLWIICALQHKDWQLPQWQPGHFTVLFFHDEAVALAAGHRPCALCRRGAYNAYRRAWVDGGAVPNASGRPTRSLPLAVEIDRQLHAERLVPRTSVKQLHRMAWRSLPDGAFVVSAARPALVLGDSVVPWTFEGYLAATPRPGGGQADVLTPPSTVAALQGGYLPQIDGREIDGGATAR